MLKGRYSNRILQTSVFGLKYLFSRWKKQSIINHTASNVASKVLAKALWAAIYHNEILWQKYTPEKNVNMLKHLKALSAENGLRKFLGEDGTRKLLNEEDIKLMNQMTDEKKYMEGYFSNELEGPILNKTVFNQTRFTDAVPPHTNRLYFYPSEVSQKMFELLQSCQGTLLVTGQRGIGKSFAIMLYSYLNQPIVEAIIEHKRNKNRLKQPMAPIFEGHYLKMFYWTIGQQNYQDDNDDVIKMVKRVKVKFMQQCEQIKNEIGSLSNRFDLKMNNLDPTSSKLLLKTTFILEEFFEEVCAIYYYKYGLRILLAVDQINVIFAQYRKANIKISEAQKDIQVMGNPQNKSIKIKNAIEEINKDKKYKKMFIYDIIRMRLNNIADSTIYNSSVNIQESLISLEQDQFKVRMGSKQNPYLRMHIDLSLIKSRKLHKKEMIKYFLDQIESKLKRNTKVKDSTRIIKQIQEIIEKNGYEKLLGGLFTRQILFNLQNQMQVDKIPKKIEKQLLENCEIMLQRYILKTYEQFKSGLGAKLVPSMTQKQRKLQEKYNFSGQMIILGRIISHCQTKLSVQNVNQENDELKECKNPEQNAHPQEKQQIQELDIQLKNVDNFRDLDNLFDREIFYIEERQLKNQIPNSSQKLSSKSNKIEVQKSSYHLCSYLPMPTLKKLLSNCLKNRLGQDVKKVLLSSSLHLVSHLLTGGTKGHVFEYLVLKAIMNSDQMVVRLKGVEANIFSLMSKPSFYSADKEYICNFFLSITSQQIQKSKTLYCLPAEQQMIGDLKGLVARGQYVLELPYQSAATDFLFVTKVNGVYSLDFFEITVEDTQEQKFKKFLLKLWKYPDFVSSIQNSIFSFSIRLYIVSVKCKSYEINVNSQLQKIIDQDQKRHNDNKTLKEEFKKPLFFKRSTVEIDNGDQKMKVFRETIEKVFKNCYILNVASGIALTKGNIKTSAAEQLDIFVNDMLTKKQKKGKKIKQVAISQLK